MEKYKEIKKLGDGSFGSVVMAKNTQDGSIVAIKKMKQKYKSWDECMELRELKSLRKLKDHINIIKLREVIRVNDELAFIFDFMDKDIFKLYEEQKKEGKNLPQQQVKSIAWQIANSLHYCHRQGFFHRDLKPENLLMSNSGIVKLCDFGLAREIRSRPPYTDYVSTRWYRAPEILLRSTNYNSPVDVFAFGCIIGELFEGRPLFPGTSEIDQMQKYCSILGTPTKEEWPEGYKLASQKGYNFRQYSCMQVEDYVPSAPYEAQQLIKQCLEWNPKKRPTAQKILDSPFFQNIQSILPKEVNDAMQKGGVVKTQNQSSSQNSQNNIKPIVPINNNSRVLKSRENQSRENIYGKYDFDDNKQGNSSNTKPPLYGSSSTSRPPLASNKNNTISHQQLGSNNNKGGGDDLDTIFEYLKNDGSTSSNNNGQAKFRQNSPSALKSEYNFNNLGSGQKRRDLGNHNNNVNNTYSGNTGSLNKYSNLGSIPPAPRNDYPSTTTNQTSMESNLGSKPMMSIQDILKQHRPAQNTIQAKSLITSNNDANNTYNYISPSSNNINNNNDYGLGGYNISSKDRQSRATSLQQNNNLGQRNYQNKSDYSYLSNKNQLGGGVSSNYNTSNNEDILGQYLPSSKQGSKGRSGARGPGLARSALDQPSGYNSNYKDPILGGGTYTSNTSGGIYDFNKVKPLPRLRQN